MRRPSLFVLIFSFIWNSREREREREFHVIFFTYLICTERKIILTIKTDLSLSAVEISGCETRISGKINLCTALSYLGREKRED